MADSLPSQVASYNLVNIDQGNDWLPGDITHEKLFPYDKSSAAVRKVIYNSDDIFRMELVVP